MVSREAIGFQQHGILQGGIFDDRILDDFVLNGRFAIKRYLEPDNRLDALRQSFLLFRLTDAAATPVVAGR